MANLFNDQPGLLALDTRVAAARQREDGLWIVAPADNILRPAGGGQPRDKGTITLDGAAFDLADVLKQDGRTWLAFSAPPGLQLSPGQPIRLEVDGDYRRRLSRLHSMTHLVMAAARNVLNGYRSNGASIAADGTSCELRLRCDEPITDGLRSEIELLARYLIELDKPIAFEKAKSPEAAAVTYRQWRVDPDLQLSGKIRVVNIAGIDQNPCSGSHVSSTAAIGPFGIRSVRIDDEGVQRIGIEALTDWDRPTPDRDPSACERIALHRFDL